MTLLNLAVAAAAFDPEAATQAYLATLKGAARAKSDAYFEGGYWLILWGALVAIASELVQLHFGLARRWRDWAERIAPRWLAPALFTLPYVIAGTLIALPWTIYTGYFREKQYDLMNQSFANWALEQGKGLGIDILASAILFTIVMAVIRNSPKRWWLWGALTVTAFSAFGTMVVPVFVKPLFNTYTEMKAGPVRDRIVAMARANNVPAEHIYVFDASKQTKRISANVSGLGPTIRISLNDNLLNRTTPAETAAVMGHELGHYVLGHVWKLILAFTLIFFLVFYIAYRAVPAIIRRYGAKWGVRDVADPAAIPVFFIVTTIIGLCLTPVTNTLIRINESQADAFGLNAAREPDGFAKTALALSEYRKIEPGPVEEFLFFDHPSGKTRIRMAMDWKAAHLVEVEGRKVEAGSK
ncbi:M48 family metallopeptidase [Sphingomonas sp. SUN039]|uniref:M48 family metallopeptidase n=1 Tax=Sphingomonas sp. SUN039 TaxID=2937787 RepID=UPI0021649F8D|nr:M48 family metallopeptidase [Sphingomonas sp. SUN039]UVO55399.1 M48 family metallopeptidase [Sphingomonas sp. SUN039]